MEEIITNLALYEDWDPHFRADFVIRETTRPRGKSPLGHAKDELSSKAVEMTATKGAIVGTTGLQSRTKRAVKPGTMGKLLACPMGDGKS